MSFNNFFLSKKIQEGQHTLDFSIIYLTTYYADSFSCHYFGEENVHDVQVFIRTFGGNSYSYVGFDYLNYVKIQSCQK